MKKFALIVLFWMAFLPLIAQVSFLTVQGYVTNISDSSPIVNHAVTIQTDSTSGYFIYNVVYTSQTGFYIDTVIFNTGTLPTSDLTVSTLDCNQNTVSATLPFGPNNRFLTHNFQICYNTLPCNAMYSYVRDTGNSMNIYFSDQSTGNNINSWYWNFSDGTYSNQQNPVHLFVQPSTYYVCLTIRSNDSTCYSVYCDTIVVNGTNGCQAQFTWYRLDSLNNPNLIQFTDLSIGAASWLWNFGDSLSGMNNISTSQNPTHVFSPSGTYHVCLTIINQSNSCQSTWCANVISGGSSGCTNYFTFSQNSLTVVFQGYLVNGYPATYNWSFGDGSSGSGQNVTHTYATIGMYYVSLTTLTDSANCNYSSGQIIPVGDSSQFHQIYGQVFENNFPLSSGIAMIFSIDSTNNNNPYNASSPIDSSGLYSFNYVPLGNFVVWVIPLDSSNYLPTYYGNVITWQQATIITLGIPANPYNIQLVQATSGLSGNGGINVHMNTEKMSNSLSDDIRMILLNESGNALQFRNNSGSGDFDFSTLAYGVYFLRAELPGCTSALVRIEITQDKPVVNVVMTYTGTRLLGINDNQPLIEGLNIYPNPVTDQLTLSIVSRKDATILMTICDLTGRNLASETYDLSTGINTLLINTARLEPGILILKITSDDGTNMVRKVIKSQ
jgi:PKD repeat protein